MAQNVIVKARADGYKEGKIDTRKEVLGWLEEKYMDKEIARKSPEGEAILKLAKELSELMKVD